MCELGFQVNSLNYPQCNNRNYKCNFGSHECESQITAITYWQKCEIWSISFDQTAYTNFLKTPHNRWNSALNLSVSVNTLQANIFIHFINDSQHARGIYFIQYSLFNIFIRSKISLWFKEYLMIITFETNIMYLNQWIIPSTPPPISVNESEIKNARDNHSVGSGGNDDDFQMFWFYVTY